MAKTQKTKALKNNQKQADYKESGNKGTTDCYPFSVMFSLRAGLEEISFFLSVKPEDRFFG